MATARRGFNSERHGVLKAVLSAIALAGFAGAWLGFARAHEDEPLVEAAPGAIEERPNPTPSPTPAPTRTGTSTPAPLPTATVSASPSEETAVATRAPKRSRGS